MLCGWVVLEKKAVLFDFNYYIYAEIVAENVQNYAE